MNSVTTIRIVAGLLFIVIFLAIAVVPYWKIFEKAGFAPALSLLMIVPLANLIVLYYVAFAEWKPRPGAMIPPPQWMGGPPPPV